MVRTSLDWRTCDLTRAFQSSASHVMLGHESSPTHQSSARGPCDRWAGCCAAGSAGGSKTASRWRDERYVHHVWRHAMLSGRSEKQKLPGLPTRRDVHVDSRPG